MRIDRFTRDQNERLCRILEGRAAKAGAPLVRYLDCGTAVIRLICHTPAFLTHVERQMTCALREEAPRFDATLVIWQERDLDVMALSGLQAFDEVLYRQKRLARMGGARMETLVCHNDDHLRFWPLAEINIESETITAWNPGDNTYYYAVKNLEPEEFIKRGHIFVTLIYRICNIEGSSLAHGAVVGLNDIGVLFCAFGYRGKSTLCVNALLDGFDYVSDDYFILGRKPGDMLRAWPIYSVVALSPQAYNALYNRFEGKFLSNNGRKDKYMFNIAAYHGQFRRAYPVKCAMFPHIWDCGEPFIEEETDNTIRETALEELCFSTLNNTGNMRDAITIGKLYNFTRDLPFYRINLSRNLSKNTQCLREFLEKQG